MKDEMIRDCIVVGIQDNSLSERMQMDSDLTLEKAKRMVRQREAVHEHQEILKKNQGEKSQECEKPVVDSLRRTYHNKQPRRPPLWRKSKPNYQNRCSRSGKGPHNRQKCPAAEAVCYTCQKKGHYSSQCFSKSVANVSISSEDENDTAYLNTVTLQSGSKSWNCNVVINGKNIPFKLDTGAEVMVVSESVLKSVDTDKLKQPSKRLCGPDRKPLSVLGELSLSLSYKGKSCTHPVYVLKGVHENLLGLPAIQALEIPTPVDTVKQSLTEQYPALFTGLGTFKHAYTIKTKESAQPFSLFTPRNVPLPLRKKVKDELVCMESLGVISRVEQPTDWCAGMVVVLKKSGDVRICVDFRPLNESLLREVHPLPTVEETLGQLGGATVFSKLDANSGFWQIPLHETSRPLTTFVTPFGRVWFNKLPFGISSAPECFHRRMKDILAGEDGVLCYMDDILIFGKNREEHNTRLHSNLKKIKTEGVTLNKDKCKFNKSQLHCLGHIINKHGISPDPDKTAAILQMEKPKTLTELRWMGMVNQLGKFSPNIARLAKPLCELLSTKRA